MSFFHRFLLIFVVHQGGRWFILPRISLFPFGGRQVDEKLLEHQKAFLLLQLLGADDRRLTLGNANKPLKREGKLLALTTQGANQLREKLAEEGYIQKTKAGRSIQYQLTDRGLALLLSLEQYPKDFLVHGRAINALVNAAREQAAAWDASDPTGDRMRVQARTQAILDELQRAVMQVFASTRQKLSSAYRPPAESTIEPAAEEFRPTPLPDDLAGKILAEFEELHRERHGHTGLVPIHEVRQRIADRFGPEAARHNVFDGQVQLLRQQQRIRMVPISDLRDATREQLNDSIPGVNETLFYLEPAHEQPAIR
jgi:hypothetical protein